MKITETKAGLSRDTRIAWGTDSSVHRIGNFVVKQYPFLNLATILEYQRFTNQVAASLVENPLRKNVRIEGNPWIVQFQVVPILKVAEGTYPLARSPYVPGPTGFSMLGHSYSATPTIEELQDDDERSFLLDLLEKIKDRSYGEHIAVITDAAELAKRVVTETGVKNLRNIARVNTKLRANTTKKELHVVITDLGAHIVGLKFNDPATPAGNGFLV